MQVHKVNFRITSLY